MRKVNIPVVGVGFCGLSAATVQKTIFILISEVLADYG